MYCGFDLMWLFQLYLEKKKSTWLPPPQPAPACCLWNCLWETSWWRTLQVCTDPRWKLAGRTGWSGRWWMRWQSSRWPSRPRARRTGCWWPRWGWGSCCPWWPPTQTPAQTGTCRCSAWWSLQCRWGYSTAGWQIHCELVNTCATM